ncbi:MAG TPA: cation transporter [Thermoproteales archaeon]|nr:cation transporter [Thermoproteales archaeon]
MLEWLALLISVIAAVVKITGGIVYGSKALFIDALTCIANLVAISATLYFHKISLMPPDMDHHYGHLRLGLGGALVSAATYSFVAGLSLVDLLRFKEYEVSIYAPLMAGIGFLLYLLVIVISKNIGSSFKSYSLFTVSELMESAVVIISSLAGALYSYILDYSGALIITSYIFYEVYKTLKDIVDKLSDKAPSANLQEIVINEFERNGLSINRIRLRCLYEGRIQGDVTIIVDPEESVGRVYKKINRVLRKLEKHGIELSVNIKPSG